MCNPVNKFRRAILHRGGKERGVAEDVEDILGGGNEQCLALLDAYAVDVRLAPEADNDHERIGVQIDLGGYLYHHAVDGEVRAVDQLVVRLGGVVTGAVLRPHAIVDGVFRLLDMQFAGFALGCYRPAAAALLLVNQERFNVPLRLLRSLKIFFCLSSFVFSTLYAAANDHKIRALRIAPRGASGTRIS